VAAIFGRRPYPTTMSPNRITPCLLGGALGDTIGLPAEGMHARRIAKMWKGPSKQRLVFGRGMVSDDTEHAIMTLLALRKSGNDPKVFARHLGRNLRWWFAALPAGIGLATARSCIRLWFGFSPENSGVFSAGNGPLMRAPAIAACLFDQPELRKPFISASTRITHTDPLAEEAAQIIGTAVTLAIAGNTDTETILKTIRTEVSSTQMTERFDRMIHCLEANESTAHFADTFGRKPGMVSGFAPDTAAVAIYAWLRHRGDFRSIIGSVIAAGGDTDTVAFVAGSIAGAEETPESLPQDWLAHICDWPLNPSYIHRVAAGKESRLTIWPLSLLRNMIFLAIVLLHGLRRILPPYR
jgi:ADP-ribosyl-[dinitrogen reductase] hydrolase